MSRCQVIEGFEAKQLKKKIPHFRVGDTIRVHMRIIEGDKERVQVFQGTVIAKKGTGLSETFSVYRNAYGSSMERIFVLHSPRIQKVEVVRSGKVRRAKLYYLRGKSGKKAKLKEMLGLKAKSTEEIVEEIEDVTLEAEGSVAEETQPEVPPMEEKTEQPEAERPKAEKKKPVKKEEKKEDKPKS